MITLRTALVIDKRETGWGTLSQKTFSKDKLLVINSNPQRERWGKMERERKKRFQIFEREGGQIWEGKRK